MSPSDLPKSAVSMDSYNAARPSDPKSRVVFSFKRFGQAFRGNTHEPTEEEIKRYKDLQFIESINTIVRGPAPPPEPVEFIDQEDIGYLTDEELSGHFMIDNDPFDLDAIVIDTFRTMPEDFVSAPNRFIDAYFDARDKVSEHLDSLHCMSFETDPTYFPGDLIIPEGGDFFEGSCVQEAAVEEFDGYDACARYLLFRLVMYHEPQKRRYVYQVSVSGEECISQVLKLGVVTYRGDRRKHTGIYKAPSIL